jgi:protein tyrosine/serine phosphatase
VLIHCVRGHDRTGIITLLLLALVGVAVEDIVTDYELSPDPDPERERERERDDILRVRNTSSRNVILDTLASLDVESYLLAAGLSPAELTATRERLLESANENGVTS